jgi:hypothetical protein
MNIAPHLMFSAFVLAAPGVLLACSPMSAADDAPPPYKTYELRLPRKPDGDEALRAVITVGELARGDQIVARTKSGEIVGTITTVGFRPGLKGGIFPLPVPPKAVEGDRVILRLEVVTSEPDSKVRPPSPTEVEQVTLKLIAVTPP